MKPSQPILKYKLILQERQNERTAEERKLQALKERLQLIVKRPRAA